MRNEVVTAEVDPLVQHLRDARQAPAVLKEKLVALRSSSPDVLVFAFEGIDDKVVYYHWINRIVSGLSYEPFLCKGKKQLLALKRMLDRDLGGLKNGVYFFVDRDYDDLCGVDPGDVVYMTEAYSFENYLVTEMVLEEVLKNEYHCHAEIACRKAVIENFTVQYDAFLNITRETNRRIFIAKRCGIDRSSRLPSRIGQIAVVQLTSVSSAAATGCIQVQLVREPTAEEIERHSEEFDQLDPKMRYRGKFALLFFSRACNIRNQAAALA